MPESGSSINRLLAFGPSSQIRILPKKLRLKVSVRFSSGMGARDTLFKLSSLLLFHPWPALLIENNEAFRWSTSRTSTLIP